MSAAPPPSGLAAPTPSALSKSVVGALVWRDLVRFFRQPSRVIGSLAQPLVLWAVLGAGLSGAFRVEGTGIDYLQYFYPGILVLTVLFTAIFSTMSVIDDRHHGVLQAVLVAPTSRASLVLGKTLGGVVIALIQAVALIALAPLAGFPLGLMHGLLLAAALALSAVAFTALGFAVAWWVDSTQGYHALMSVGLLPLWMLSGAMFPPPRASAGEVGWIGALMRIDPMTYVVSAVRRGLHGAALPAGLIPSGSSGLTDLAVIAAFAAVALSAAVAACRRSA